MLALVEDTSAHPRAMCYKCDNESIPPHTRMQPYLESIPDHTDGAPPYTPSNTGHGITPKTPNNTESIPKQQRTQNLSVPSPSLSLRQKSLAQARVSLAQASSLRLGEGSKRKHRHCHSRLGETSSPERDVLSLKVGAPRLSDSSCRQRWANTADLA
ncbi:hypothetical protein DEO72_LG4g808 [Vigna unguiculata]|uniref:Uncharacterized protein n=1 Tax=Vigna unguiculata TaxID=3917 RepID=A0A4D6LN13_VIGUN|nr:hypothetical protein DEO72_LG4g808 [Vigna unguiculata]